MTKADAGEAAHGSYYAAMALKARVALYAASWLGNNAVEGYANLYQIAQKAAEDCIANSGASFYSRYSDTWNMNNENVADNKEAIWGVHYTSDLTKGSTSNCIPHRYKTDANGTHLDFSSLITRTGYTRGGSAMLLMFQGLWNNSSVKDVGSNGTKNNCIFVRVLGTSTAAITSAITGKAVDVSYQYSPYGRGFQRYLPSYYLWETLEQHRATDQRVDGTLLSHYNIVDGLQQNRKQYYPLMGQYMTDPKTAYEKDGNYFNAGDTAIYFSPLDGDSPAGKAEQAWAKGRYRIMFAKGGDLPIFDANGLPTEAGPKVSSLSMATTVTTLPRLVDDTSTRASRSSSTTSTIPTSQPTTSVHVTSSSSVWLRCISSRLRLAWDRTMPPERSLPSTNCVPPVPSAVRTTASKVLSTSIPSSTSVPSNSVASNSAGSTLSAPTLSSTV